MNIEYIKKGLMNIGIIVREGNVVLFWRQAVVVLILFIGVYLLNSATLESLREVQKVEEARIVQKENEDDYKRYKSDYVGMLSTLPPNEQQNEWFFTQMFNIADKLQIRNDMKFRKLTVERDGIFSLYTLPVDLEVTFEQLGHFVEAIENSATFLRISELTAERNNEGFLGKVKVSMLVNTIFVDDKDYSAKKKGGKNDDK